MSQQIVHPPRRLEHRRLGFKYVFDTNFSADVTIMEEGTEFIKRFTQGGNIPLLTSCCPAWTDWME